MPEPSEGESFWALGVVVALGILLLVVTTVAAWRGARGPVLSPSPSDPDCYVQTYSDGEKIEVCR